MNGVPYSGPVQLKGTSATIGVPSLDQIGGSPITYTLILTAGAAFKTLTLTQEVSLPILAVANYGNSTVAIYNLSGITKSSTPVVTLKTGSTTPPTALAFDEQGNLWVAAECSGLEEFKPPFASNEGPTTFSLSGSASALAFDASGNLWVGERSCSGGAGTIQEYRVSASGLTPGSTLSPGGLPLGLAFDQEGNLWVTGVGSSAEILEYTASSSFTQSKTYVLPNSTYFGSLAFDAKGNLYSFIQSGTTTLEELPAGTPPPTNGTNPFIQLFSVSNPSGLAFDASGNLWVSGSSSGSSQIQEFTPPFSTTSTPSLTVTNSSLSDPYGLAIWPIPQGLPIY